MNQSEDLYFVKPSERFHDQWYEVIKEFKDNNEEIVPLAFNYNISDFSEYLSFVRLLEKQDDELTNLIRTDVFYLVRRSDEKIIGVLDIRSRLTKDLNLYYGQIGMGIRPTERRKGYGTQQLKMGIEKCKELGYDKMLITCASTNIGSRKIIEKLGGEFDGENQLGDVMMRRYWLCM